MKKKGEGINTVYDLSDNDFEKFKSTNRNFSKIYKDKFSKTKNGYRFTTRSVRTVDYFESLAREA